MLLFKLAAEQLFHNKRFAYFFIANLLFILIGFGVLDTAQVSIKQYLDQNLKEVFNADIKFSARRELDQEEIEIIETTLQNHSQSSIEKSKKIGFFNVISNKDRSKLSYIQAIDTKFPLYGFVHYNDFNGHLVKNLDQLHNEQFFLADKSLALTLNLNYGDRLKIGNATFTYLGDAVTKNINFLQGFADNIYISKRFVEETQLMITGSRINYSYHYKLNANNDSLFEAQSEIYSRLKKITKEDQLDIRTQSYTESNQNTNRIIALFKNFMSMIVLITLFITGIGLFFNFNTLLNSQVKNIAILELFGLNKTKAAMVTLIVIFILSVIATLISFPIIYLILEAIEFVLTNQFNTAINLFLSVSTLAYIALIALFVGVILFVPFINKIRFISLRKLLSRSGYESSRQSFLQSILGFIPVILGFYFLAIYKNNIFISVSFISAFILLLILISVIALFILRLLKNINVKNYYWFNLVLSRIYVYRVSFISSVVCLSLIAILVNTIPQIRAGLLNEISLDKQSDIPNLLITDIQDSQLEDLDQYVESLGYQLEQINPMIKARILEVNGIVYSEYRKLKKGSTFSNLRNKPQREDEVQSGRAIYNISYKDELSEYESIVEGLDLNSPVLEKKDGIIYISVAKRFAKNNGYEIGTQILFEIQGVEFLTQIANLRKVKWNSFQPNFFILFPPKVLEDAPKIFIASIKTEKEKELEIQNLISKSFFNIISINISSILNLILNIVNYIVIAIASLSLFCIIATLITISTIIRLELNLRKDENFMLNILGMQQNQIKIVLLLEFSLLTFIAIVLGLLISTISSLIISQVFFESIWNYSWAMSLLINISFFCIILILILMQTRSNKLNHSFF